MQAILNGSVEGLGIGVLALAFMMVYSGTRIFYIGLAGVYTLVPYIIIACTRLGLPPVVAMMMGAATGVLISILCEIFNHWPLEKKKASWTGHLITSLGIYIILVQVVTLVWGSESITIPTGNDVFHLWDEVILSESQVVIMVGSLLVFLFFYSWLKMSRIGLQIRALADNPTELSLYGYNIRMIRISLFGISGLLASFASYFSAAGLGGFDANSGLTAIFLSYIALIVGGKERFSGAILGGLLLGNIQALTIFFLSSRWKDPVTFAILALFLLFRPQGILGKKNRLESE